MSKQNKLNRLATARIPFPSGDWIMHAYGDDAQDYSPQLALIPAWYAEKDIPSKSLVRVHSECLTGDIFHSLKCDCGAQLDAAMERIADEGGVLIYLRQEGRGIGIVEKLKAYQLQNEGLDTVDANLKLGHAADQRTYEDVPAILDDLGITEVRLITNNPDKIESLQALGVAVVHREALIIEDKPENEDYMKTKKERMGHLLP